MSASSSSSSYSALSHSALSHSMFQNVVFPAESALEKNDGNGQSLADDSLMLRRLLRFVPPPDARIEEIPVVVFDFETTGLDAQQDRIIEIGAEKLIGFEVVDRFSTLVHTNVELTPQIQQLTGISPDMLTGMPPIEQVLPEFFKFIDGSLMVAHNAEFDWMMLKAAATRLGYDVDLPCFCTLKMARVILPAIENRKLDTLAGHYGLEFTPGSRHRSTGDVRVTSEVLRNLVTVDGDGLECWKDLQPYQVV